MRSYRLLIGILPFLAACDGNAGGMSADAPEWLAAAPEPVQLAVTLDTARARSKVITSAGGTVTATGADGTRYSLRFPPDALLSDEVITLIPVAKLDGLPLAGDGFSTVQLEPSGLQLMQPAMLTIRPRTEIPADEQVAFGYFGDGADAHLAPILPKARGVVDIPVHHFSGYGYGRAAPGDPGRIALQKAESTRARLSARIAAALMAERVRQLMGADEDAGSEEAMASVYDALVEYYDAVIRPLLETALADDRMAVCAMNRYLSWEREVQLLGFAGDDAAPARPRPARAPPPAPVAQRSAQGNALFVRLYDLTVERRTERALQQCRDEQDFSLVSSIIAMEREAQLLGRTSDNLDEVMDRVWKCLSFEIEFFSVIEWKTPTGGTYHHVGARVPYTTFARRADGSVEPQTAPLQYVAFRASGNPLRDLVGDVINAATIGGMMMRDSEATLSAAGTRPGTARVFGVVWNYNRKETPGTNCDGEDEMQMKQVAENFRVIFGPGEPVEVLRLTPLREGAQMEITQALAFGMAAAGADGVEGALVGGPTTSEETYWASEWARLRRDERIAYDTATANHPGGVYQLAIKPAGKGVWRADYNVTQPQVLGFSASERSYVVVKHAPR